MLKIIEFTLLAVSLLVVIGLIVSGTRTGLGDSDSPTHSLDNSGPEAHEPGKSI
jgi:uncharacterized membrane protein